MAGLKHDDGKQAWHSLPLELLEPLADLMEAGCKKYGKFNCLDEFDNPDERFWNANMRHAAACQRDPLAIDQETGCYHEAARAFSSLMRIYHCRREQVDRKRPLREATTEEYAALVRARQTSAESSGYTIPTIDDGDDWGGGKGQCSLERESQIVAEEVRAFGEQLAAKLNNTVLCLECGRRWPLGSEQGRSVSDTGRCIVCRADEDRATYTVPPPQDGDDDPIVHVVPDRTPQSGEVEASASTKRKYAEPITWLPCPND